jgi:hypothetical protein
MKNPPLMAGFCVPLAFFAPRGQGSVVYTDNTKLRGYAECISPYYLQIQLDFRSTEQLARAIFISTQIKGCPSCGANQKTSR